ncbi:TrkH family potassium uptake protein [Acetobacterium wieringae]|uniref:Ktr system potassium uptake protein B n=1 Tax=Acetobacterium wieringae TaxID=52694 RepID=A0A1F2PHZ9_9FIRM|nr:MULTISPECIES: TrkH family potassium uptake protein [Acetobacterium]OFV70356.1 Ktr system potassium uptake protein B [Acetobacterium wieringae]OXS27571.1 MAG: Trk family potassium uptake protein [Acetobacterium sp. MES1]URN85981.1 TrkH family potassium uptake protein [Acetobacterium wieringae]UYO64520.1 TrkH family potassium uptake protein [Acetobacterium wieringae]VUZ24734.1 Ktr system potassium uptake protein B [Acetobacterium wieringae]
MAEKIRWNFKKFAGQRSPAEMLIYGFALVILLGAILLTLPMASASGTSGGFINALFTATSAVCVTGLVVVDTGTFWSVFGKVVIILLIQIGGLGFMSLTTMFFVLAGKRITIKDRLLIQSSVNMDSLSGVVKFTKYIFFSSLIIETVGALLLALVFIPEYGFLRGTAFSFFHSISAFCNAGFDLFGNYSSLTKYVGNFIVNFVIGGLIILGGLGFAVTSDIINIRKFEKMTMHAKLALTVTGVLLIIGFVLFFVFEYNNPMTMGKLSFPEKLLAAAFQSITPRTAGYNTIDIAALTTPSLFLTMLFMFIGASPGSTGGGVKTTTFAIIMMTVVSVLHGRKDVVAFKRSIMGPAIRRSISVIVIALGIVIFMIFVLLCTEPEASFETVVFEVLSAFGTVGLTTGLTPHLSTAGKIAISLTMFVGRLGPLTVAYAISRSEKRARENVGNFKLPEGNIMIG